MINAFLIIPYHNKNVMNIRLKFMAAMQHAAF